MPLKRKSHRTLPPTRTDFIRELHHEWNHPQSGGEPLIIVEGAQNDLLHVYVVWEKWRELPQVERSEIIMDVIENLAGDASLKNPVSVAMGLTADEAARMGISPD